MTKLPLTHCTLTGVDAKTDLQSLCDLSREFPVVEWGFLYSPKRQGQLGRYPSVDFLSDAFNDLPAQVRVALHVCGSGVSNLLDGEPVVTELAKFLGSRNGRIQLNFNARAVGDTFALHQVRNCIERFSTIEFITQYNEANTHVWESLKGCKNHSVLFDASGGRGIKASRWETPLLNLRCGYAGGLGPENVALEARKIGALVDNAPFWIDMEGKLRDRDDWFDLKACQSVLKALP